MKKPANVWMRFTNAPVLLFCAALCASASGGCAGQQVKIENQTVIHEAPRPLRVTYSAKVINSDGTVQWQEGQRIDYEYQENLKEDEGGKTDEP